MKRFLTVLLILSSTFVFSQVTYDKEMVDMVNVYRKSNRKKPIKWSNTLHEVSKIQIHRSDSIFRKGNEIILEHDLRLLKKLSVMEVLAFASSDTNKRFSKYSNPFIKRPREKPFLPFIKRYFKKLYKEITTDTKVGRDIVIHNLSIETQDKVRIAYVILQWHYSPGHKKIILSRGTEMSAGNVINGNYLISIVNIR